MGPWSGNLLVTRNASSRGEAVIESYLGESPVIAPSAYVHAAATVIGQVEIQAEASIWPCAVLRGDDGLIRIGARSSIQDGSVAHTTTELSQTLIGEQVTVGHNVTLHGCIVEANSIIGMGSILLDNCHIGERVLVGAGTLVPSNKQIPDGVLVLGQPARVIRELTDEELEWIQFSWRSYVERAHRFASRDAAKGPVS